MIEEGYTTPVNNKRTSLEEASKCLAPRKKATPIPARKITMCEVCGGKLTSLQHLRHLLELGYDDETEDEDAESLREELLKLNKFKTE